MTLQSIMKLDTVLVLDQTQIKGHEIRVTGSQELASQDLSGDTSNSEVMETGFKPVKLAVSMRIAFKDQQDLLSIVQLARALGEGGTRKIYQVQNITAEAYKVRQVRFNQQVRAAELADEQSWQVSFTLVEYNTVPERDTGVTGQDKTTSSDSVPSTNAPSQETQDTNYTGFEKVLAWADNQLGNESTEE